MSYVTDLIGLSSTPRPPFEVIISTSAILTTSELTVYIDIYQNPRVTKSRLYLFSLAEGVPFIFNLIDRDRHHQRRKIIGPFLAERSVRMFETIMSEQIEIFLKQLLHCSSESINVTPRCSRLGLDIAAHLGFGYSLELQTREENRFISDGIAVGNYRIHTYMNFPFLSKLGIECIFKSPMRLKWRGLVEKMMKARLARDKAARHDYYSHVMESIELRPEDAQHSELFAESLMFMSAGT